jgi:hypothetical protein
MSHISRPPTLSTRPCTPTEFNGHTRSDKSHPPALSRLLSCQLTRRGKPSVRKGYRQGEGDDFGQNVYHRWSLWEVRIRHPTSNSPSSYRPYRRNRSLLFYSNLFTAYLSSTTSSDCAYIHSTVLVSASHIATKRYQPLDPIEIQASLDYIR